jgi:O-antigen/teichoic acid export membrane protein
MKQKDSQPILSHVSNSVKNLIGTIVYFFCQWLILIIIIRIAGFSVSGEFSLVIAFTNLFGFLSQYNIRNFQLSDVKKQFTPQQYSGTYIITSGIAIVLFFLMLPFSGYNNNVIFCCLVYMVFKLCETFTMYFFTYMQLEDRFSNIAVSYCLKGIVPLIGFTLCLYFYRSLLLSICVMILFYLAVIILYDLNIQRVFFPRGIAIKGIGYILKQCFPMMLSTLVTPFMLFLTRHTVEKVYGTSELGFYSAFTMVIVIFSTMAGAVYVVLLPAISKKYAENQKGDIVRIIFTITGIIIAATLVIILLTRLAGDWIFSFVFGFEILPYMYLLLPVIITSAMLTIMTFLSTCLIAMHKRITMLISMLTGVVLLCVFVVSSTKSGGLLGTTNIFTLSLAVIVIIQCFIVLYSLRTIKS